VKVDCAIRSVQQYLRSAYRPLPPVPSVQLPTGRDPAGIGRLREAPVTAAAPEAMANVTGTPAHGILGGRLAPERVGATGTGAPADAVWLFPASIAI
jgi:hypothetical protein